MIFGVYYVAELQDLVRALPIAAPDQLPGVAAPVSTVHIARPEAGWLPPGEYG